MGLMGALTSLASAQADIPWEVSDYDTFHSTVKPQCSPKNGCEGMLPARYSKYGTETALLTNGNRSLRARLQTLRAARHSIRIQALIFTGDEAGVYVANILKEKKLADPSMDIRVIVDAISNPSWQTQWMYYDLKQHGIEVEGYESGYLSWINEASLIQLDNVNLRHHEKMWIIDGEDPVHGVAIVGGMNIANEYMRLGPDQKHIWRDQDAIVRGPIVRDVVRVFEQDFAYFKKVKADHGPFNTDTYWKLWNRTLDAFGVYTSIPYKLNRDVIAKIQHADAHPLPLEKMWVKTDARFLHSRPRYQETYIQQAYIDLITHSNTEVLIANAYFLPTPELYAALQTALLNGVDIHIIDNSVETNDTPLMSQYARYLYLPLMETPARVGTIVFHEWRGDLHGESTIHAKYLVADRQAAIIGSYNLDPRSQNINSETALAVHNPTLARELAETFWKQDIPKTQRIYIGDAERFHRPENAPSKLELFLGRTFSGQL